MEPNAADRVDKIDINLLRKMYDIVIDDVPEDPEVLARRPQHIAAAARSAKWHRRVFPVSSLIWFVLVAIPLMSEKWRLIISTTPVVNKIFYDYATFSGLAKVQAFVLVFSVFVLLRSTENYYGYNNKQGLFITTSSEIDLLKIYPRTKQEETAFWGIIICSPMHSLAYTLVYSLASASLLSFMKMKLGG